MTAILSRCHLHAVMKDDTTCDTTQRKELECKHKILLITYCYRSPSSSWASQQRYRSSLRFACYFAFSFTYNAMAIIVSLMAAITNGIPLIMGLYVLLAVLYLSIVAFTWVRQSRRITPRVA